MRGLLRVAFAVAICARFTLDAVDCRIDVAHRDVHAKNLTRLLYFDLNLA
jgi:hypothetical protein